MRIALFVTCLADALFSGLRHGHGAVARTTRPPGSSFRRTRRAAAKCTSIPDISFEALPPVRHHVEAFETTPFDVAVAPSGSCVGSVRHQHAMVAHRYGDDTLAARAESLAGRTYELSELLVDVLGVTDVGA